MSGGTRKYRESSSPDEASVDKNFTDNESLSSIFMTSDSDRSVDSGDSLWTLIPSSSLSTCRKRKCVRFGQCNVRLYSQVLGDHPCCSVGCPLELGWEYETTASLSVDNYESEHQSHTLTRLAHEERREILLSENYSDVEVRRACRRLHRDRRHHHNAEASNFFSAPI